MWGCKAQRRRLQAMFQGPSVRDGSGENICNNSAKAAGRWPCIYYCFPYPPHQRCLWDRVAAGQAGWQVAARLFCIAAGNNSTALAASPSLFWSISPFAGFLPVPVCSSGCWFSPPKCCLSHSQDCCGLCICQQIYCHTSASANVGTLAPQETRSA